MPGDEVDFLAWVFEKNKRWELQSLSRGWLHSTRKIGAQKKRNMNSEKNLFFMKILYQGYIGWESKFPNQRDQPKMHKFVTQAHSKL